MTIIDKIKQSVTDATGVPCYYQSEEELNRILDNAQLPCALFVLLRGGQLTTTNGHLRERVQVAMFFADKTDFDFTAHENEEIINKQKQRAYKWLLSLNTSKLLRVIGIIGTERAYTDYDVILTGYAVNVTLEELRGVACV